MTDYNWGLLFLVSLIVAILSYFLTDQDKNPVFITSFLSTIVSGMVLYIYMNQPQSYVFKKVESRTVSIYQGTEQKQLIVNDVFYKESTDYLGGLIKDSTVKWVKERDISSNGASIPKL